MIIEDNQNMVDSLRGRRLLCGIYPRRDKVLTDLLYYDALLDTSFGMIFRRPDIEELFDAGLVVKLSHYLNTTELSEHLDYLNQEFQGKVFTYYPSTGETYSTFPNETQIEVRRLVPKLGSKGLNVTPRYQSEDFLKSFNTGNNEVLRILYSQLPVLDGENILFLVEN